MPLQVWAIVPAAGRSTRMGRCKQLLPLPDRPAIVLCLESLIAGGVSGITVVIGPEGNAIREVIAELPVMIVENNLSDTDMAESIRQGLQVITPDCHGVMVALADHPLVTPRTIKTILNRFHAASESIIIPCFAGKKGHPVIFPRPVIEELGRFPTLRHITAAYTGRINLVNVDDPGVIIDLDTPEDYRQALERTVS